MQLGGEAESREHCRLRVVTLMLRVHSSDRIREARDGG
jgi:hypothetical protein